MSDSYKHTPYVGLRKHKASKRKANREYKRKSSDIDDGMNPSDFKKFSESWNICDYHNKSSLKQWKELRKNRVDYDEDAEELLWQKWYRRK